MFRGMNPINLDGKGRLAIPSRYRESISDHCDGRMVVTIDTETKCLLLYPQPEWDVIQEQLEQLPSYDPGARRVKRLLIGHATDLDMDSAGRVLLPAPLRDYASLEKRIVLLGQGKKFEIWSEDLWNATRDLYLQDEAVGAELPEQVKTLSL